MLGREPARRPVERAVDRQASGIWKHHEGGQVFNLSIHPWLMGMAHRIKYLDEALRRVERFGNVWQATPGEIAQHYMNTMM